MKIVILYEDADVLAVDKPEGLASIPESDLSVDSAQRQAEAWGGARVFVVHRLDKSASGVLIFARHAAAHRALSMAFEARAVVKIYRALLIGPLERPDGEIDAPLRIFGSGRAAVDPVRGKPSRTAYHEIERLPGHSLVQAEPKTGRLHQLRAHFYSIAHPIAGDLRYGTRQRQEAYPRMMLHAERIELASPSRPGETLRVDSAPRESFDAVLAAVRDGRFS